jgi:glycosyltransferase involved in cell wall biosynthesis
MQPGKGQQVHLEALSRLREVRGWECWQIGGPQTPAEVGYFRGLHQQAARLGIAGRVRFWGLRPDVARLLGAADIYCQPNDTFLEGLGNTFIEAMRAGLPVVTTAIGAAPEVVDDSCGVLLRPGDISCLAATLEKLILDPAARARLASGGPPRADALFAPKIQILQLCEALRRAVSRTQLPADCVNLPEDRRAATNLS